MCSLEVWIATFRLHTASPLQAPEDDQRYAVERSRSIPQVTTSSDKRLHFSFKHLTDVGLLEGLVHMLRHKPADFRFNLISKFFFFSIRIKIKCIKDTPILQ